MEIREAERSVYEGPSLNDSAEVYIRGRTEAGDAFTLHVSEEEAEEVFGVDKSEWEG